MSDQKSDAVKLAKAAEDALVHLDKYWWELAEKWRNSKNDSEALDFEILQESVQAVMSRLRAYSYDILYGDNDE